MYKKAHTDLICFANLKPVKILETRNRIDFSDILPYIILYKEDSCQQRTHTYLMFLGRYFSNLLPFRYDTCYSAVSKIW